MELSNRLVCFDIKQLGKQLKKLGMLIVQDFGETVYKGQNDVAIEQKPLARFGVGDIRHLLRGDIELLREAA